MKREKKTPAKEKSKGIKKVSRPKVDQQEPSREEKKAKAERLSTSKPTENLIVRLQLKDISAVDAVSIRMGLESLLEEILGERAVATTQSLNYVTRPRLGDLVKAAEANLPESE